MNRREALKNTALFMGYAASASTIASLVSACKTDSNPKTAETDWKPTFFTADQYATVAELAETLLPRTKTPGAKDVGAPQFIDAILKNCTEEENRKAFTTDLKVFMDRCAKEEGKAYPACDPAKRSALLGQLEEETMAIMEAPNRSEDAPPPFYMTLKSLAMTGYFLSEKIGKEVLRYDPIPGDYQGCIPYTTGQHTWAF